MYRSSRDDIIEDEIVGTSSGLQNRDRVRALSKARRSGTLWENLAFSSDDFETTFHIWTSQNCTDLTLRVHGLLVIGWLAGWMQSCSVLLLHKGQTGRTFLVNTIQALVVVHEILQARTLLSNKIECRARHHAVKAKMHAFLHLATVSMVIVCSGRLFDSKWHAFTAAFLTSLSIIDGLPLFHLIRLHLVKIACFEILLFANMWWGTPDPYLAQTIGDALMLLVMGSLVPLSVAAFFEYRKRIVFLHDMNERPSHFLGSFWTFFQWIGL